MLRLSRKQIQVRLNYAEEEQGRPKVNLLLKMAYSHGRYCSLRNEVLRALPKQPFDYLCQCAGFVNLFGLGVVGVEFRKGAPHAVKVWYGDSVPFAISVDIGTLITAAKWTARDKVYRLQCSALVFGPCAGVVAPPFDIYSECGVAHSRCASIGETIAYGEWYEKHTTICHYSVAMGNKAMGVLEEEI